MDFSTKAQFSKSVASTIPPCPHEQLVFTRNYIVPFHHQMRDLCKFIAIGNNRYRQNRVLAQANGKMLALLQCEERLSS
jgi:hypothetical protein